MSISIKIHEVLSIINKNIRLDISLSGYKHTQLFECVIPEDVYKKIALSNDVLYQDIYRPD